MVAATKKRPEELLHSAAAALKKQWPGLSLRAVAAKLQISPSYWSKILRGEKPLTIQLLPRVVEVLRLDAQQTAQLQRSILRSIEEEQLAPATGLRTSENNNSPVDAYLSLGRKEYWLLEQWYYIPVLNFVTLNSGSRETKEIAKRLGISLEAADAAVRRLAVEGFLAAGDSGWEPTNLKVRFPSDRSHASIRAYHLSMIKKAGDLLTQPNAAEAFDSRLISSVCFAGSSEKLKEAKLILEEAMFRAANLMAGEPVSDEVYQLNLQLFPLSR